ncbi:hypothetical protein BC834DRAFT_972436 [Gloeopeniophorella convolvens]|nr:hypothetical protein BC834DRAFT_972436 [Gloeopeniophorella convolvens]
MSLLDLDSMLVCESSCHRLRKIAKHSVTLQYLKAAGKTGVYDPFFAALTFPERFGKLYLWSKIWEEFNIPEPSARYEFDIHKWASINGSMQNGCLIATDNHPTVYARSVLPTRTSSRPPSTMFAFAEEYDLMAVISAREPVPDAQPASIFLYIRLSMLFSLMDQPLADQPHIDIPLTSEAIERCSLGAEIMGDYLTVTTCSAHSLRQARPRTYLPLVTFLSETTLAFVQKETNAIELCEFIMDGSPALRNLHLLGLPAINPGVSLSSAKCQADRIVGPRELTTRFRVLPFYSDPRESVLYFTRV